MRFSFSLSSNCLSEFSSQPRPSQRNGIEDARFVCFQKDDGSHVYYATFTAFDGKLILPELVETTDFLRFRFITLNGPAAENKGMALFPGKSMAFMPCFPARTMKTSTSCFLTTCTSGMNERCCLNRFFPGN